VCSLGSRERGEWKTISFELLIHYSMFITETQIRVRYAETDQMNVVYYGNYAQYFEVARAESIRNLGYTYKEMELAGIIMPVVEMQTKFLRPAHYDDLLTIRTILRELPADHKIQFEHEVYNQEKKLLTLGKVILYIVKIGNFEKTTLPDRLRHLLESFFIAKT
jgi:acyl-CoA thioester hydrolase